MKMKKQCLMIKNRKIVILHKNVYTKFVITIKNKKTVALKWMSCYSELTKTIK